MLPCLEVRKHHFRIGFFIFHGGPEGVEHSSEIVVDRDEHHPKIKIKK
jgi:hypothetical protein